MTRFDKNALRGRWHDILLMLGVPKDFLRNKHGPCPFCGGTDRYRFSDKDGEGRWICNQCGHGDGIDMAMRYLNIDFVEFKNRVEPLIGNARMNVIEQPSHDELQKERTALWMRGKPVQEGDPVDKYLFSRLGEHIHSTELRTLRTTEGATMLARYLVAGQKRGVGSVHRTFLTSNGEKIDGKARKLMRGTTVKGGAIRLGPATHGVLGLAEGIETALSACLMFYVPVWATISEAYLRKCEVPDHVNRVIIFADNDANYIGQAAAYECANRLQLKGKQVEVKIPQDSGDDWNDVLLRKLQQSRVAA